MSSDVAPREERLSRSRLLLGNEAVERLARSRVILFGVGGVGSWAAEALVRTGVGHLTIVDNDRVVASNINRQLPATIETVGELKVEALRRRLLTLNPDATVTAIAAPYTPETAEDFDLESYDCVIDAIDSLSCKAALINHVTRLHRPRLFSSMGAALKTDPTRVATAEFWHVKGCPLARALRQRFKRTGEMPRRKFKCVYSDELQQNKGVPMTGTGGAWDATKAQANGSLLQITGIFGFTLAGLVVNHITAGGCGDGN